MCQGFTVSIGAREITHALSSLGVCDRDMLYVHSGLSSAIHVEGDSREEKMDTVIAGLAGAAPGGVLAMPTFTYSFCRGEPFDVAGSPSTVGMLTEHFRHRPGVRRTAEPIFSSAILGEVPPGWGDRLYSVGDKDCFGPESIFALLSDSDAKLVFFGVGFEYCTFLYRVEQQMEVPYRYLKRFEGDVIDQGQATRTAADYFVRDLDAGVENDFAPLLEDLLARDLAHQTRIPRGPRVLVTSAGAVTAVATERVRDQPRYLLRQ